MCIALSVGGHSITTWTRWGGRGSKNVCFCPRSGYKNCPCRGGGRKMAKFCPRSCWMPPNRIRQPVYQIRDHSQENMLFNRILWVQNTLSNWSATQNFETPLFWIQFFPLSNLRNVPNKILPTLSISHPEFWDTPFEYNFFLV